MDTVSIHKIGATTSATIERGDRIMQAVISPVLCVAIEEVDEMKNENRGGFGTTGIR